MEKQKPAIPPEISKWGAQRRLDPIETLMWRVEADPRFRSNLMLVELFDRAPAWKRFVAAHEWGSRMVPRFRKRVIEPALQVGAPSWAVDPDFDIAHHLKRIRLPFPGSQEQLLDLAQTMAMAPFDRARPPWEAMLVEGLADGRAGYLLKMHHVVSDGLGAMQLLGRMHSRSRQPDPSKPQPAPPPPDDTTPVTLLGDEIKRRASAMPSQVAEWSERVFQGARRTLGHPGETLTEAGAFGRSLARFLSPPTDPSPLLKGRSLSYRYLTYEAPLELLKAAAKAAGGSVNDAFLAAILGTFGLYHRRFRSPVDALGISIPVSLRAADDPLGGNRISAARFASMRRSASAKNKAKTTTGTTAPCAAEAMGLAGTSARKLCSRGGRSGILALSVRSAASPVTVQLLNSAEPSATPNTAEANRSTMNTTSARRATPVAPPAPSPVPMPTTISAKTSGMIAIRRPSSQMPPAACKTGSTAACGPEA